MSAWRAIYCRGGMEISAARELSAKSVEAFCLYERFKRHFTVKGGTQVRWIAVPVFNNYIFARTDSVSNLKTVKGIVGVVSTATRVLAVPNSVIESLRRLGDETGLVKQADLTKNSSHFSAVVGDKFSFTTNSRLKGLVGQILSLAKLDESGEITAWVEAFGRTTEVTFPYTEVDKILTEPVQQVA